MQISNNLKIDNLKNLKKSQQNRDNHDLKNEKKLKFDTFAFNIKAFLFLKTAKNSNGINY